MGASVHKEETDEQADSKKSSDEADVSIHRAPSTHVDDPDNFNLSNEPLEPLLVTNQYTVRKTAAQGLMDFALMMANIAQLRTLITAGSSIENYIILMGLVCFSLLAQLIFAVTIFLIWIRETEDHYKESFMSTFRRVTKRKLKQAGTDQREASLKMFQSIQEAKLRRHQTTNRLNYGTIVLVFIISVTNMFITGFGIKLKPSAFCPR